MRGLWTGGGERARWVSGSSWMGAKLDIVRVLEFWWWCLVDATAALAVTRGSIV
jgi:hypothetical protein